MLQTATFASGCFWCSEAVFQRLKGVKGVQSGYTGGVVENPTYEEVSSGTTGHAEAIEVQFDPSMITYQQLLHVFFELHDPTTPNRQGADIGTQYRSAIFYHSEEQKRLATQAVEQLNNSNMYQEQIITEVVPATKFYPAEKYHNNYYNSNFNQGYCRLVIQPKLQKLYKNFAELAVEG